MGSTCAPGGAWYVALPLLAAASGGCSLLYSLDGNLGPLATTDAAVDALSPSADASDDADQGVVAEAGATDTSAAEADAGHDAAVTWCTTRLATDSLTKFCRDFDQPGFAGPLLGAAQVDPSESYTGSAPASLLLAGTAGASQGVEATVPWPGGGTATASFELHVEAMPSGPDPHILQLDFGTSDVTFLFLSAGNDPVVVEWDNATSTAVGQQALHPGTFFVPGSAWWSVTMTLTSAAVTATIDGYGSASLPLKNAPASPTQVHLIAGISYQSGTTERFHLDDVALDVQP